MCHTQTLSPSLQTPPPEQRRKDLCGRSLIKAESAESCISQKILVHKQHESHERMQMLLTEEFYLLKFKLNFTPQSLLVFFLKYHFSSLIPFGAFFKITLEFSLVIHL